MNIIDHKLIKHGQLYYIQFLNLPKNIVQAPINSINSHSKLKNSSVFIEAPFIENNNIIYYIHDTGLSNDIGHQFIEESVQYILNNMGEFIKIDYYVKYFNIITFKITNIQILIEQL